MNLDLDKSTWKRVRFGDVVRNVNKSTKDPESLGIGRVIAMEHMDPGELKIDRWGDLADGTTFTRVVTPGQTLFGKRRAYQRKVAYAEFDAICSGDIYTFEAIEGELLPRLLPFLVQSEGFFNHALGTSAGSLSPRTNWRDLAGFEFDLPPVEEQERLADLLWAVEEHHESLRESEQALDVCTNRMTDIFDDGHSQPLRQWVDRVEAGRSPKGSPQPATDGELGVLKVSAVGKTSFMASENKRLLDETDFRASDSVHQGDVLVTRANANVSRVAYPCIVDADYPNLMLSDKTLRLVPNEGIPGRLLLAVLKSPMYRSYVSSVCSGTEAKNISQAKILAGPIPVLGDEAIRRLHASLLQMDSGRVMLHAESNSLTVLRASLLDEIFGGN